MTTYFKQIKIEIASHADVKRPELDNKKSFFCIYFHASTKGRYVLGFKNQS